MDFTVGSILEGKVQSIAKFGAFITLPDGQTGLVHISEIAGTFVKDIHDFLSEGQSVQVKVIAVDAPHRISLSIKQAQPDTARPAGAVSADAKPPVRRPAPRCRTAPQPQRSGELSFEEKLKAFLSESNRKIAGLKQYSDHKTKSRRR